MSKRLEEAQILELLKLGDPTAVEYWFTTYRPKLQSLISRHIENSQEVLELTQETFIACLKQLPLFRGEAALWTWMVSIAKHQIADHYRKKYAKKALQLLPLSNLLLDAQIDDAHEVSEKVLQVLSQMSESSRELLQKKYVDEQKVSEIARDLGRSIKSIESELFRARIEFRELYLALE